MLRSIGVTNSTPGKAHLRVKCQTSRESGFVRSLFATGARNALPESAGYRASGIEVRHAKRCMREKVQAAPGYDGPRVRVLTTASQGLDCAGNTRKLVGLTLSD
jgi:hypothetical protein